MQEAILSKALERLIASSKSDLLETTEFFQEYKSTNSKVLSCFSSTNVKGDITHPSLSGRNNILLRGCNSESTNSKITINGENNIIFIGPHSRLSNSDIRINCSNSIFYFGGFTTVESMTTILSGDGGKIEIGDYCMLSARIIIDRSDHHSIYDLESQKKINLDQDVIIEDHAWIGRDVRISKGAMIGKDAIIGQASLVTGKIQSSCAYGGVPAKLIREGVTWSRMKCNSLEEMIESDRHKKFLKMVENVKQRTK
ncbi:acyltransferase [Pseudomonas putida]|uniref:acyltransferase n=1 Tax=Pseudomonas putida TaxID=303 RepID=UPI0030D29FED